MYYNCSYCPEPTSLPVVSEGLMTDMEYDGRCVNEPMIETLDQLEGARNKR